MKTSLSTKVQLMSVSSMTTQRHLLSVQNYFDKSLCEEFVEQGVQLINISNLISQKRTIVFTNAGQVNCEETDKRLLTIDEHLLASCVFKHLQLMSINKTPNMCCP